MAFALRAWTATAVVVCCLAYVTLTTSRRVSPLNRWQRLQSPTDIRARELWVAASQTRWRARPATEYLTLLERRDSTIAFLESRSDSTYGFPILLFDANLPVLSLNATDSIIRRQWRRIGPHPNTPRVAVSVRLDTADVTLEVPRRLGLGLHLGYTLPNGDRNTCITIVTIGKRALRRNRAWEQRPARGETTLSGLLPTTPAALLGPCAYYAAFGMPGGKIRAWLETVNYGPAMLPNWVREPPYDDGAKVHRARQWWPEEHRTEDLYPCASGDTRRCRSAVLTPVPEFYSFGYPIELSTIRPAGVVNASRFDWATTHPLGLGVRSYLSDLVNDMGFERFSRFWSSDEAVDTAFNHAFGVPIEQWTMNWARSQVGKPRRGPAATPRAIIQAMLVAAVFLGGGIGYASRRQVT